MKKTLLTLSTIALALSSAQAQMKQTKLRAALTSPGSEKAQKMRQIYGHFVAGGQAAKTTALTQRLVGYSSIYQGSLYDSARYVYNSPTRGSIHTNNNLESYFFGYYPPDANLPMVEGFSSGASLNIKFDTAVMRDLSGDYTRMGITYNAANEPTQYRTQYLVAGISNGRERYTMTYNSAGQRTELLFEVDTLTATSTPGPYIIDNRQYTFYGGTPSRALRDSIAPSPTAPFSTDPYRYLYSYTGNNLTAVDAYMGDGTGGYVYDGSYLFTYDASNRVRTATLVADVMGSGTPTPFIRDSLVYTGSNTFPTATYVSLDVGAGFQLVQSQEYTINAQNLRDTMRTYDGTGDLITMVTYQYNSYGNPDSYRYYDPAVSMTVPEETGRFYYELYDPTSVKDAPAQAVATAYPNPVADKLALRWPAASGTVQMHITDALGRLTETASFAAAAGAQDVDMSRYAPGTYFVTLQGAGIQQSLKVVKK